MIYRYVTGRFIEMAHHFMLLCRQNILEYIDLKWCTNLLTMMTTKVDYRRFISRGN